MTKLIYKSVLLLSLFLLFGNVRADDIYSLIKSGHISKAKDSISTLSTASLRDGNILFYRSLLEPEADKSARLMEASLNAAVDNFHKQEIYYRLAQYYFLKRDFKKMSNIVNKYRSIWEAGRYQQDMTRLAIISDQISGAYESALRQIDRSLLDGYGDSVRQLGEVDKARLMATFGKKIGSEKILRGLSREKKGPGVPMALYSLADLAISKKRTDDAVFYYNILREGYPLAIGLDALIDKMSTISEDNSRSAAANELTGTFYSVKVGVFSRRDNANRQADRFRRFDKNVSIKSKKIADKNYRVVFVGHFKTYDSAARLKKTLESAFGETFQVVAR